MSIRTTYVFSSVSLSCFLYDELSSSPLPPPSSSSSSSSAKWDRKLITGYILMEYDCCFYLRRLPLRSHLHHQHYLAVFNDNRGTGTASSYGLLATRDTPTCVCLRSYNIRVVYGVSTSARALVCVCVLCRARVPPEIKTCNFVVNARPLRACARPLSDD